MADYKCDVTGLIMYDSEHALGGNKLVRQSDWEIHPVFRLEFCPKGKDCAEGDWIDIKQVALSKNIGIDRKSHLHSVPL